MAAAKNSMSPGLREALRMLKARPPATKAPRSVLHPRSGRRVLPGQLDIYGNVHEGDVRRR
jgi:hypothetical protein